MTLRTPRQIAGQVIPFNGTTAQRAENRLSHAWEQVPNPVTSMPLPARVVERLTHEEATAMSRPPKETLPKCSQCGCWGADLAASWKCGNAPRYTETKL